MATAVPAIRLLIADDHTVLRAGLKMLFGVHKDIKVVGEAGDGADAVEQTRALRPDLVLLDIGMPGPPSGEVIRGVLAACPTTRVLILTMHDDTAYLAAAMAAGAAGYVVKKAADAELMSAIRAVHAGRTFVDLTKAGVRPDASSKVPKELSEREREVLALVAQGYTNQEIAMIIHVGVKTVETYRTRLSVKLGLKGRAELHRFAVESGVIDMPSSRTVPR